MPRPKKEKPNRADGLYEVKITIGKHPNGKLIRKSFYSSISKAFDDWARNWLKTYKLGKVKGNTYNGTYRVPVELHLIPYFGSVKLNDIRSADIQAFFNSKKISSSLELMRKMRNCLYGIFETACENELCRKNPVTKTITLVSSVEKATKCTYSQQEYDIVEAFAKEKGALDILLLLQTGISRSELLGLKWKNFDADINMLYITQGTVQYKDPETEEWVLESDGLKKQNRPFGRFKWWR